MADRDVGAGAVLDDRYVLGDRIGRGGSGVVHRAWDRERGRAVAVKLLPAGAEPVGAQIGRRESDILAELDHPRIVALHDVLDTGRGTALVMELVDGPSLHQRLQRGALPLEEAAVVLRDVAAGLAHAHRRGVVHRDVKPGNVLLRLRGEAVAEAKLSDFGIARRADATRTTAERTVVGTLRFLSPEQARGERVTAASDVYSLGLTVLAAITGADAFPGPEAESLAGRLLRTPAVPAALPDDWADLLRGMTALAPEDRLDASATAALASALGSGRRPEVLPAAAGRFTAPLDPVGSAARIRSGRRRGRTAVAIAGVALAGALLGGAVAVVVDPAAVEQALPGALPAAEPVVTEGTPSAPAAAPRAPAPAPAPASDDRVARADGSGHGSGHGGGHGGHGSDD
ncbi:serine/threonine-protein kinase [Amnibacterium kyonggiense]|uniref:non-specific serine/threonine protein kinase n=1 Tax=Amnibacterium kyonggiense TaxID=595671 RepID=A0A4R7FL77_9MICO|nr:serine/threonine-protein kinase [Amnibacterium kyonggiense]TDS77150.1 serine/threonine protein kinase [Amnibacterium kyonggiense]